MVGALNEVFGGFLFTYENTEKALLELGIGHARLNQNYVEARSIFDISFESHSQEVPHAESPISDTNDEEMDSGSELERENSMDFELPHNSCS